ncbi:hypothetical protein VKT23_010164 [Stygiomarasmius scandens]|uniref:DUF6532 domain-containing protein n=1 Tax=Marasmiellus scandens TaxID=2682957 RepID=A0ABR1JI07_9AGAR
MTGLLSGYDQIISEWNNLACTQCKSSIGGLDKDWTDVYGHKKAATSSSSLISTGAESDDGFVAGEFDHEEPAVVVESSRRMKTEDSLTVKAAGTIKLAAANVAEIDRKDRENKKQSSGTRSVTSSKHLPFLKPNDNTIWDNSYLPELYNWVGTICGQFTASSDPDFQKVMGEAWMRWFPHLPAQYQDEDGVMKKQAEHPAIESVTKSALSSFRSDLAKKALFYVEQKMNEELLEEDGVEEVKAWVAAQRAGMAILYESPDTHKGVFKSEVVSQTLAWYLGKIRDSPTHRYFGFPAGALALTAAAIKCALNSWKDGSKTTAERSESNKQAARNGPNSFSQPTPSIITTINSLASCLTRSLQLRNAEQASVDYDDDLEMSE